VVAAEALAALEDRDAASGRAGVDRHGDERRLEASADDDEVVRHLALERWRTNRLRRIVHLGQG
jgi:hypothetical protein